jgi:hypothetical protein
MYHVPCIQQCSHQVSSKATINPTIQLTYSTVQTTNQTLILQVSLVRLVLLLWLQESLCHGFEICSQRWNSWTAFLVEVSGHKLESSRVFVWFFYSHFSVLQNGSLKVPKRENFFARVFCSKRTHLGMWLRVWGKKSIFLSNDPWFRSLMVFCRILSVR